MTQQRIALLRGQLAATFRTAGWDGYHVSSAMMASALRRNLSDALDAIEALQVPLGRVADSPGCHDAMWPSCPHCGAERTTHESATGGPYRLVQHRTNCAIVEARRLLGMPLGWSTEVSQHGVAVP